LTRSTVSGGADPRTFSLVFLFEEFVPIEYCQQLSTGVQNKRMLASFVSPGKSKQWKQASTLNGHPYVSEHIPRGLNSQEEEFKGLLQLQGNNSSTKRSLGHDGPIKREVTHSEGAHFGSSLSPTLKHTRPDLLFAGLQESTVHPSTPLAQAGTPKQRFHLLTGLPLTPDS
jgi:hypothetical protein